MTTVNSITIDPREDSSDRRPAPSDLEPASAPSYDILGPIAQGGMAAIYLARARIGSQTREVVVKRLAPGLEDRPDFVTMFEDEGRLSSRLAHRNVARVLDVGTMHGGAFIAMELLRGVNLAMLEASGDTPIPIAVEIAAQSLDGLRYAHALADQHGRPLEIVHRDISPENILVGYDGIVRVLDFGVAKARYRAHLTAFGLVKGKFGYMAPEQVAASAVDLRTDLFALATVLYELLTGVHPFEAESPILQLQKIVETSPRPPQERRREIPFDLERVILRGLAKTPSGRFEDAEQMREALDPFRPAEARREGDLARFVVERFRERLDREEAARASQDDAALVAALSMTVRAVPGETRVLPSRAEAASAEGEPEAVLSRSIEPRHRPPGLSGPSLGPPLDAPPSPGVHGTSPSASQRPMRFVVLSLTFAAAILLAAAALAFVLMSFEQALPASPDPAETPRDAASAPATGRDQP